MLSVISLLLASSLCIDGNVPAGNIVVEKTEGDVVRLSRELRGTIGDWFYWAFRVKGAKGRTLTFAFDEKIAGGGPVGVRGPAVTTDGGKTWGYPCDGKSTKSTFAYTFESDDEVRFYETWQYLPPEWEDFLARHAADRGKKFEAGVLCRSRKGRPVPKARFGCLAGTPRYRIFLSSRHHCSEATATPVLEGVAAAFLADDDLGRWLCANVELMLVPFVDYDGVVEGDQGKNRAPHDHNRDYTEFLYPETRAIRDWILSHAGGRLDIFIDVHCPWIRDNGRDHSQSSNEYLYTPWKDPAIVPNAALEKRYSELLEKLQCGSMRYCAADDVAFGRLWNNGKNYHQGRSAVIWACQTLKGLKIARSYEVPFANANGAVVTPQTCRDLGRDTAKVFRALLSACGTGAAQTAQTLTHRDIQTLVDAAAGSGITLPPGRYEIGETIRLPSHTHLVLKDCHLRMKDGVFAPMFMSVGTEDVSVDGGGTGVLDGGEPNGLNEGTSKKGSFPHVSENLTFSFIGVKGLAIKGLEIRDQRWWAMMFAFCEQGKISQIRFRLTRHRVDQKARLRNQDGIDLRVGCHDFEIEDISGETGDDVVAMTALRDAWNRKVFDSSKLSRDIHHVRIRRIRATSVGCSLVRILAHYGNRIHDIDIRDIQEIGGPGETGFAQSVIRIGDRVPPYYGGKEENAQRFGDISDIFIDGIRTRACAAVVTDDGIRNLTVRNIVLDRDGGSAWLVGAYTMQPFPFLYIPEREAESRAQTFVRGYPSAWNIHRRDTVRCENVHFENVTANSTPHFDEALFRFSDAEFVNCSVKGVQANGRRLTEVSNCRNLPDM